MSYVVMLDTVGTVTDGDVLMYGPFRTRPNAETFADRVQRNLPSDAFGSAIVSVEIHRITAPTIKNVRADGWFEALKVDSE